GALITARIIGQDMTICRAVSWTSWVAVNGIAKHEDGNDYADSLISASPDFSEWSVAERYYGFAHFSKYIPVGSTVLDIGMHPTADSNDFNAFAFRTPDKKTVLVIVNEGGENIVELMGELTKMTVIESNRSEKLKTTYDGEFKNSLVVPAFSITTAIFE
ncbi:MAG: hypothetical protein IJ872_05215, partial [Eubacterium sp.]|nr:hypothetical protein [Eubacterium sp.]